MITINNYIHERLILSKSQIIDFKDLIALFTKVMEPGIPIDSEKIFGSKPIFYTPNDQNINYKIKKCNNKPIDKIGFIEETPDHNACVFFIVNGVKDSQPIGVQDYKDLLESIGSECIIKLKNYLIKNAKH